MAEYPKQSGIATETDPVASPAVTAEQARAQSAEAAEASSRAAADASKQDAATAATDAELAGEQTRAQAAEAQRLTQAQSDARYVTRGLQWTSVRQGLRAWTENPAGASSATVVLGKVTCARCPIPADDAGGALQRLAVVQTATGSGLAAGQCFLGVYLLDGTLIAKSGDMAAAFGSNGEKNSNGLNPVAGRSMVPPAGQDVIFAMLVNGTTSPNFARQNLLHAALSTLGFEDANQNLVAYPRAFQTTALFTDLPDPLPGLGAIGALASLPIGVIVA